MPSHFHLADAALAALSLVVALTAVEAVYRIAAGVPVLSLSNWRTANAVANDMGARGRFDPVLGWTLKSRYQDEDYTTLDHGIRQNFEETTVRTGAVLAVGDSFTEGLGVNNHETWPAHLEHLTDIAVVNAGVSGYGADQIVMRAEQLLPIVRPQTLIVGFLDEDILRAGFSMFGASKPYFTLENGELELHAPAQGGRGTGGLLALASQRFRDALGHSALADRLLSRLAPDYWYLHREAGIDEVAVTCALLERLKRATDSASVRVLLFMQHGAGRIADHDRPAGHALRVAACAGALGIRVVDQFAALRGIATAGQADALRDYYQGDDNWRHGHMSPKGNEHAAALLAAALSQ